MFSAGLGGALLGAASIARAAITSLGYVATPFGPAMVQRAYVRQPDRVVQQCAEWCWAASCAMIFSMFNHPTDQEEIVQRVFGGNLVCAPSPRAIVMADILSDTWTDSKGQTFVSQLTAAYDPQSGVNAINNAILVNEISNDRPILYANTHHAMVIVSVDFVQTAGGPDVQAVGVLDPWPFSPAYHMLTHLEMVPAHMGGQMTFAASVQVS